VRHELFPSLDVLPEKRVLEGSFHLYDDCTQRTSRKENEEETNLSYHLTSSSCWRLQYQSPPAGHSSCRRTKQARGRVDGTRADCRGT
jgi:hypothetical protein